MASGTMCYQPAGHYPLLSIIPIGSSLYDTNFPQTGLLKGAWYHAVQFAEVGEVSKVSEFSVDSASANLTSGSR